MTKNPASATAEQARIDAHAELTKRGFVFVEETAEYRHADGTRGRLVFMPDHGAPLVDKKTAWTRAVKLQQPGRAPMAEELMSRTPTIPAMIPVITYW